MYVIHKKSTVNHTVIFQSLNVFAQSYKMNVFALSFPSPSTHWLILVIPFPRLFGHKLA